MEIQGNKAEKLKFKNLKNKKTQAIASRFVPPIAETASPGPVVSVPTHGSQEKTAKNTVKLE